MKRLIQSKTEKVAYEMCSYGKCRRKAVRELVIIHKGHETKLIFCNNHITEAVMNRLPRINQRLYIRPL